MILINKKGLLFNKKLYKCSLGKNGLSRSKVEGDNCTPVGLYSLGKLYIRTDRIKNLKTHFKYVGYIMNYPEKIKDDGFKEGVAEYRKDMKQFNDDLEK